MGEIQHCVTDHDRGLFVLAHKAASQRLVRYLLDCPFPDPLPELRLRRPELFSVNAHN